MSNLSGSDSDKKPGLWERWPGLLLAVGLTVVTGGMFLAAMGMAYEIDGWMGQIKPAKTWFQGFRNFMSYTFSFGQAAHLREPQKRPLPKGMSQEEFDAKRDPLSHARSPSSIIVKRLETNASEPVGTRFSSISTNSSGGSTPKRRSSDS